MPDTADNTKISGLSLGILVVLFTSFIAATYGFGIYLFAAIAPDMQAELGFSYRQMGITTGLAQAGFLISALASGFLTSWLGAFRLIMTSIITCGLCLAGLFLAENFLLTSLFLILLGCCAASVWVPMVEVSQDLIPQIHRGKALGLMSSGTSYGVFINSILILTLLNGYGWRALWAGTTIIVLLIIISAVIFIQKISLRNAAKALSEPPQQKPFTKRLYELPAGTVLLIMLMMFLNGLSCLPFQTYLSSFLLGHHGLSVQQSASAWQIIGLVGMFGGFAMGWLADHITVKRALSLVYMALASATSLMLFSDGSNVFIFLIAFLFGLSFYSIFGLLPAYISLTCKEGSAALVFAFGNVALGAGGILGNILGGAIKEQTGSLSGIYMIILCSSFGLIICSFFMPSDKNIKNHKSDKTL